MRQVLDWLGQASASKGRHKPVLSVGRDGIFVPIRNEKGYKDRGCGHHQRLQPAVPTAGNGLPGSDAGAGSTDSLA